MAAMLSWTSRAHGSAKRGRLTDETIDARQVLTTSQADRMRGDVIAEWAITL